MSSFDEEYNKIYNELMDKLREIDKISPLPGLDDTHMIKSKVVYREYNKKLLALKEKYNVD